MHDVDARACADFVRGPGASLVFFDAPWSPPARALELILRKLEQEADTPLARIARVDIERHPLVIDEYELVATPTCDLFVNGEWRKRVLGCVTRARLLESLQSATLTHSGLISLASSPSPVPTSAPVASPLLQKLQSKVDRIDALDEDSTRLELSHHVSHAPLRVLQPVGPEVAALAQGLAPLLFSLIREVSLLTRFMTRQLRSPATPDAKRVGLATALTFVAMEPQASLLEYLDDWLVLQAARFEFLAPDVAAAASTQVGPALLERMATLVALAGGGRTGRDMHSVLRQLASMTEALEAVRHDDDGLVLLDELLRQPLPTTWVPSVLPTFQRLRREHFAYRLASAWASDVQRVTFASAGRVLVRFHGGATLEVVGTHAYLKD